MNVAICGVGTVGRAVHELLHANADVIERRVGARIRVAALGMRNPKANLDLHGARVETDVMALARAEDVDVLVELIGGTDTARTLVLAAIDAGKHVVTANKALIAEHGNEILAAADRAGVTVAFEAAVAGGIPLIKAIREGLAGNRIAWLAGMINGTSNYILSEMRTAGSPFGSVLADAQRLGYAEADPTFDVDGTDAAHKLAILASIAFGVPLDFPSVHTEGIDRVGADDIAYAGELGYRIKPLAIARLTEAGVEARVHPTLIPQEQLLANVDGVLNAVLVASNAVGPTLYYGPGAGGDATASAVIADLADVARHPHAPPAERVAPLGFRAESLQPLPRVSISEVVSAHYLRILAEDRAGVLADITSILSARGISIESVIQKESAVVEHDGRPWVPIILLTHRVRESLLSEAMAAIEELDATRGSVVHLRIESLDPTQI